MTIGSTFIQHYTRHFFETPCINYVSTAPSGVPENKQHRVFLSVFLWIMVFLNRNFWWHFEYC